MEIVSKNVGRRKKITIKSSLQRVKVQTMANRPGETQSSSTKSRSIQKLDSESNGTLKIKKAEEINFQLSEYGSTQPNNEPD